MTDPINGRDFDDLCNHAQALAKLVALVGALAAQHPDTTSVEEIAGPLAFVGEVLDDTIERAIHSKLYETADRCPSCQAAAARA